MGAVCGIYLRTAGSSFDHQTHGKKMMENLILYPYDMANTWNDGQVFFGNTNNHITPESCYEVLPRFLDDEQLAMTSDAIIDNRDELMYELGISEDVSICIPDSELILKAYLKWGEDCPKHLIGDYAFAIWDKKKKMIFCVRDHVGKRTLYYYNSGDIFAFATVIKPLLTLKDNRVEFNEEWIANNLATNIPLNQLDTNTTVYKDVYQLPPSHVLKITVDAIELLKYWDPCKVKRLKLKNNEEYEKAFRKVYFEAIKCRLRSNKSVGVLLSSGLDSGSVACIAAPMLNKEGKSLKAYTSVPFEEYKDWVGSNATADESELIKSILRQYNNIDVKFCASEGINSYNSLDRLLVLMEFPFKYVQNLFWVDELVSNARKEGCSVILNGQSGNYTVSFGDIASFFYTMITKGKLVAGLKEAYHYSIANNRNYKSVLFSLLVLCVPKSIISLYKFLRGNSSHNKNEPPKALINSEFAKLNKIDKKLKKYKFGKYASKVRTIDDIHRFTADGLLFSQAAEVEAKLSLQYGIVLRDPTRDKRVIEFCMSLPETQMVHKGVERSIIKRSMKNILPDKIRLNNTTRGVQSADWIQRLNSEWDNIKVEYIDAINKPQIQRWIDKDFALDLLKDLQQPLNDEAYFEMQMIINLIAWKRFICSKTSN